MDDNWKGEHLIRTPKPEPEPEAPPKPKVKNYWAGEESDTPVYCCYPGCGTELGKLHSSGVCRSHAHQKGFCKCSWCSNPFRKDKS